MYFLLSWNWPCGGRQDCCQPCKTMERCKWSKFGWTCFHLLLNTETQHCLIFVIYSVENCFWNWVTEDDFRKKRKKKAHKHVLGRKYFLKVSPLISWSWLKPWNGWVYISFRSFYYPWLCWLYILTQHSAVHRIQLQSSPEQIFIVMGLSLIIWGLKHLLLPILSLPLTQAEMITLPYNNV